jgi:predicted nuclease of restriction endonuclease-like (RecB) superfamily
MSEERLLELPAGYAAILADLKDQIKSARLKAGLAVNRELVLLYWRIGRQILKQQHEEGWGSKVIERLSLDLRREFPEMKGFSPRNLKYMRRFAEAYQDETIVQEVLAQITWYHHITILEKVKEPDERDFYIRGTISHGWSRNVLVHQIESDLFDRQGRAQVNFERTLPAPQSELARQILKDPYNFDFLTIGKEAQERDLETALLSHLQEFLLELGVGFAFVGSQYHLELGDKDFYIDLLFYHLNLRCYVVIDLKISEFQPEHAGKMNFYLSAVDDILRHPQDEPSIGIVLCKGKNRVIAEYALRGIDRPMGIAEYQLSKILPEDLKGSLPTIEELEAELEGLEKDEKGGGLIPQRIRKVP